MRNITLLLICVLFSAISIAVPTSGFYATEASATAEIAGLGRIECVRLMFKPNSPDYADEMPTYSHYLVLYLGEPVIIDRIDGHTITIQVQDDLVTVFYHSGANAYLYKKYEIYDNTLFLLEEGNAST
ncbi:hypothetical protein [Shewanella loihica]|uniref:hypothetical protein n=1 Tax=Shewanella loihica TaxID=359303 RepID=UPI0012318EFD|nr:hypothetical protein [Shewanella loihica]